MRIILFALLSLLMSVSEASAAGITLGQLPTSTHASCTPEQVYLQSQSAPGLPSYTVPSPGGIITSWSESPLGGAGTESFLLARPNDNGTYRIVAKSPQITVSGVSEQTFPTHMIAQTGDVLALDAISGSFSCIFTGANGDFIWAIAGNHDAGDLLTPGLAEPEQRLNLTATLEPDADKDGYADVTEDLCPTDPSTQSACPLPTISGLAQVGQTLTGIPNGSPAGVSYAWLRCDGTGESCYAIAGASSTTYTVLPIDIGHKLRFSKLASNDSGSEITESKPTSLVPFSPFGAVAPKLTHVSQSAKTWRGGSKLASYARVGRPSIGTTFKFHLDLPATMQLRFSKSVIGRLTAGKCSAPSKHNRHGHSCRRTVTAGTLNFPAHVGNGKISFQGRLSRSKRLTAGLYSVALTAIGAGLRSNSVSLSFTIV